MCSSQGDSARLELLSRVTVIRSLLVDQLNEVWGSEDLLVLLANVNRVVVNLAVGSASESSSLYFGMPQVYLSLLDFLSI